jgi:site-specific DNA-methyltransferase (adenine-specific)
MNELNLADPHVVTPFLDKIIFGDCLDVLPRIPAACVDAVVTDPPFAITGGLSNGMTSRRDTQFFGHWFADVARELIRVTSPFGCMFFWCDWRTVSVIDSAFAKVSDQYSPWWVTQVLVHDREMIGMGSPFRNQCDWIAVVRGKKTKWGNRIPKTTPNVFRQYSYYGKHANHPSEKTVSAARLLVEWASSAGDVILDPFCGSATTCFAAREAGRRWIGIEREEDYVAVGNARLSVGAPLDNLDGDPLAAKATTRHGCPDQQAIHFA